VSPSVSTVPGNRWSGAVEVTRLQLAWLLYGVGTLPLMVAIHGARELDFRLFYDSALAWRHGLPLYALRSELPFPNLNPPTLAVLLAPLSYLPFAWALAVMTAIGAGSLLASLKALTRVRMIDPSMWPWIVGAIVALPACQDVWIRGQVTWLVLYPVTRAWLSPSQFRGGAWLGLAIAIKPPLALAALLLPRRLLLVAAAVSLGVSALIVSATGVTAWTDWLALSDHVWWLPWVNNMSLFGVASRMEVGLGRLSLSELGVGMLAAIALVGLFLAGTAARTTGDRRWGLALLWSLLLSPAGWVYYLPLACGPMLPHWPRSTISRVAMILMALPLPLLVYIAQWPSGRIVGSSTYGLAALLLWIAWLRSADAKPDVGPGSRVT
jgi:Glycosyltransferase family 87